MSLEPVGSAESIDGVVRRLDRIIEQARSAPTRAGFFAALYRKVTVAVRAGIADGFFDDGPRMERLDVLFANRYLAAWNAWAEGNAPSRSWAVAFDATRRFWPIVLQHLLLGMNAHINLDLGIAAARTSPGDRLPALHDDFGRINQVLSDLTGAVQSELARIWRPLTLLNHALGGIEDEIIDFSMTAARDDAWRFAGRLAPLERSQQALLVSERDHRTAQLADLVQKPGLLWVVVKLIRIGEVGTIGSQIDVLSGPG